MKMEHVLFAVERDSKLERLGWPYPGDSDVLVSMWSVDLGSHWLPAQVISIEVLETSISMRVCLYASAQLISIPLWQLGCATKGVRWRRGMRRRIIEIGVPARCVFELECGHTVTVAAGTSIPSDRIYLCAECDEDVDVQQENKPRRSRDTRSASDFTWSAGGNRMSKRRGLENE